ncbi:MAG: aspartate/glutamate racemase family protein [Erysipelotrichaceae bacterium]
MNSIGIVDSGLGGYTVYETLRKAYPSASFVFLADQQHTPYGNKSPEEIIAITYKNMRWFYDQGIREVILACNTTSSVALELMKEEFPEIVMHGIIDLTVDALDLHASDKVLIMATKATIESRSYPKAISERYKDVTVDSAAMLDLVHHIEYLSDETTINRYLESELAKYAPMYTKIVLACTHFPIVKDQIAMYVKGEICDSRQAIVDLLKDRELPQGQSRCFTSGDPQHARHQVKTLFDIDEEFTHAKTGGVPAWK